jgi:hypothetical protein
MNLCTRRAARSLLLWTSLALLLCISLGSKAQATDTPNTPVASVGPGPQFAIADFDGDLRPDLATVQSGTHSAGDTNYWIQLQLTASERQSIRLSAPAGGLLIAARDVNGDHAVDLVLATAFSGLPVAVLLNDGHGQFSQAKPTVFPGAFTKSTTNWATASGQTPDAVGVPPPSGAGIYSLANCRSHAPPQANLISLGHQGFVASAFVISRAGRAPPSEVPYL